MPVDLEETESSCILHVEGEVGISSAAELKNFLIAALATGKELHVDLEHAKELDPTALQLLWAAVRQARETGTKLVVSGRVPEDVAAASRDAGF